MKLLDILNEGPEVLIPNTLTDKQIKKAKLIYKTFKKGEFPYDEHSTYSYVLPDDYYIFSDVDDDVCVQLTNKKDQDIKMFSRVKISRLSDDLIMPIQPQHTGLHRWIRDRIAEKFIGFNIKFVF
jgi:hypothetical protein